MPTPEAAYSPTGIVWLNRSARLAVVHISSGPAHAAWLMGPDGEHMTDCTGPFWGIAQALTVARAYYDEQYAELGTPVALTNEQARDYAGRWGPSASVPMQWDLEQKLFAWVKAWRVRHGYPAMAEALGITLETARALGKASGWPSPQPSISEHVSERGVTPLPWEDK